jgi:hypothetical protein
MSRWRHGLASRLHIPGIYIFDRESFDLSMGYDVVWESFQTLRKRLLANLLISLAFKEWASVKRPIGAFLGLDR